MVTGCWANVNPPGGRNSGHTHPNNYLAAVYYVATPDNQDKIEFEDPRPQAQVMMPRQNAPTPYTVNTISFTVKPGRLVLFPAWLRHAVPINRSKIDRISFAFNLMFRNFSETMAAPLWDATAGKNTG